MRIYIAGLYSSGVNRVGGRLYNEVMNDRERQVVDSVRHKLESYHYVKSDNLRSKIKADGARVFLDSGAFSAFTLGKTIDLGAYCEYIKANPDMVDFASVLDGIGDPFKTYQNQCVMEAMGTRPLPCFHWGEDERYLEHYIANYDFITLGGMVPHSSAENKQWLDRIWDKYLCNPDGSPKIKVHGFGMTSIPLMERYPWFSVDSSSWVTKGFNGQAVIPEYGIINVQAHSSSAKVWNMHTESMASIHREAIVEAIERRGFTYERISTVYISRWIFNLNAYLELEQQMEKKELRFQAEQITLF